MKKLLAHEWVEAPHQGTRESVVMLHGILGRRRNLLGFARAFVKTFPHLRVLLVDHRNHGESQGFHAPHTLAACAKDLHLLIEHLDIKPLSVIGHSFGAGVAFTYARDFGGSKSIWLLDAVPSLGQGQTRKLGIDLELIFKTLPSASPAPSKLDFAEAMRASGLPEAIVLWLSMNLWPDGQNLVFRPDADSAREMLEDFQRNYLLNEFKDLSETTQIFLVKAERNLEWKGQVAEPLKELVTLGNIREFILPNAGHFVHIDNPHGILDMMEVDFA